MFEEKPVGELELALNRELTPDERRFVILADKVLRNNQPLREWHDVVSKPLFGLIGRTLQR